MSIRDLARALAARKTPGYANAEKWGIYSYEDAIYPQARLAFPEYNKLYDTNEEFTNYFVLDLNKKDSRLVKILGEKTVEKILIGDQEIEEGQVLYGEVSEQAAGAAPADQIPPGESPSTMAGGISFPSTGSGTTAPRRIIHVVDRTPTPETSKSELLVTNKSGVVREAGDPSKLVKATRSGAIAEPGQPSKLITADSSGRIVGGQGAETPPSKPQLVVANKSGVIQEAPSGSKLVTANSSGALKGLGGEAPTEQIFIANKSGVVTGVRNIKSPSWLKTFGSNAQIFARKNLGRIAGGLTDIAKGVGRGIAGPALNGTYSLLGKAANGGLNAFGRLSNISGPKLGGINFSKGFGAGKKVALAFSLFGLFFGISLFSAISQSTSEASPQNQVSNGLDFTLPIRDPSIIPQDVRQAILQKWPNAQIDNWQTIIDQAIAHGWNPAVLLTLWIEESGAQGEAIYTDPLGCDVTKPSTDIQVSLNCFFNNFDNKFTNDQFGQFLLTYSAPNDPVPFYSNPNFPGNFKSRYSKLVPTGTGAITAITSSIGSCPAVGKISTPFGYNIPDYPDVENEGCGSLTKCHNGIDIAASEGAPIKSTLNGTVTFVGSERFKGSYVEITDTAGLIATFEHLSSTAATFHTVVSKGAIIGAVGHSGEGVTDPVLHYKLKKGGILLNPFRTLGSSATLDPQALTQSDDISQNNYLNRKPADSSGYWGQCNQ